MEESKPGVAIQKIRMCSIKRRMPVYGWRRIGGKGKILLHIFGCRGKVRPGRIKPPAQARS